jgi:hypothetical protein
LLHSTLQSFCPEAVSQSVAGNKPNGSKLKC